MTDNHFHGTDTNDAQDVIEPSSPQILLPTQDFGNTIISRETFCDSFDIHSSHSLHDRLQQTLVHTYDRVNDFVAETIETQLAADISLSEQLFSVEEITTLSQLATVLNAANDPLGSHLDSLLDTLTDQQHILGQFQNSEIEPGDVKELKAALPELSLAIRKLTIASYGVEDTIPRDDMINGNIAEAAGTSALALHGVVTDAVLNGNRNTAAQFVAAFKGSIDSLAHELMTLCNPVLRFEDPTAVSLFSGTSQLSIAMDAVDTPQAKIGLRDFTLLNRAARSFEPARTAFAEIFGSIRQAPSQ